jgi:ClpP class serine protease
MSTSDLIWYLFIIFTLSPMVQQKLLAMRRLRALRQFEQSRGSRVIALIHRQETMRILGFPVFRYIDIEDSEEVLRAIRLTDPQVPIDIVLHTPGGLLLAAEQIAFALKDRSGKVTVFVPHYAMSGGTLLALAADEIVMDPHAVLGPVDPQLGEYAAASILKVVEQKDRNEIDDRTLILADVARKSITQVRQKVKALLVDRLGEEKADALADLLTRGEWTHDNPIMAQEAKGLGLNISTAFPVEVHQFMAYFAHPTMRRPGVEYIPIPYRERRGDRQAP